MKTNSIFAFFILISSLLSACQSTPIVAFDNVAVGASKGEVLNDIGSPTRSYRKNGNEHWVYKLQTRSGVWVYQELIIRDGVVVRKEFPKQSAQPQPSDYEEIK